MTIILPSLVLNSFSLGQDASEKLALSASGHPVLVNLDTGASTPIPGIPEMTVGVGTGVVTPQEIKDAFANDGIDFDDAAPGLWLQTSDLSAAPRWFSSIGADGVRLYGQHVLPASALTLPGFAFSDLQLRVALQTEGTGLSRAFFAISGRVAINGNFAYADFNGVTLDCDLQLDLQDGTELGQILDDPQSILEAAFEGRLRFRFDAGSMRIGSHFSVANADMDFDCQVVSPANSRDISLGDTSFSLSADRMDIAGTRFDQLDLDIKYTAEGQKLTVAGASQITLPAQIGDVVTGAGTGLDGRFTLEHGPAGAHRATKLNVTIDTLTLAPEINFASLSARDLTLQFNYLDKQDAEDSWNVSLSGSATQSWGDLATNLQDAGIITLPEMAHFPDIAAHLDLKILEDATGVSGQVKYRMDLIQPGTAGPDPVPYDSTLGPMPLRVAETFLTVTAGFDQSGLGDWAVTGSGTLSSTGWLDDLLPLDRVDITASASGDGVNARSLKLAVSGGLPPLRLPAFLPNGSEIDLIQPDRIDVMMGDSFRLQGHATIASGPDLVDALGLPGEWSDFLTAIATAIPALDVTFSVKAALQTSDDPARLSVVMKASDPDAMPTFRLMDTLRAIATATETSVADVMDDAPEFLTCAFDTITMDVSVGDNLELALAMSLKCSVFGETFDAAAMLRFVDGQPEFVLMGGLRDPIRLTIPSIDVRETLGDLDAAGIVSAYNLDAHLAGLNTSLFPGIDASDPVGTVNALGDAIMNVLDDPENGDALVFELRDFGLKLRLDEAPSVSGTIRMVQMPGIIDKIMPDGGFDFGIGCSARRIFISVKGPAEHEDGDVFKPHQSKPLLSLPLGKTSQNKDLKLDVFFGRFELEYEWATTGFGFVLDAAVIPNPEGLDALQVQGNGVYFPGQRTYVDLKAINTGSVPIVIPEWSFIFDRGDLPIDNAQDELGFQVFGGVPGTRWFTAHFKQFSFSPTYFAMQPGVAFDGGFIIGSHQPKDHETRKDLKDALLSGGDFTNPVTHIDITNATAVALPSALGVMMNPLTIIPPYFQPLPPFWIWPPTYMGDLYFDSISMSVTIPHVLHFSFDASRPLPHMTLQAMMELAGLAMSGFSETIPPDSPLREVLYITLDVQAALPLIDGLVGSVPEIDLFFEVNVADLVNGLVHVKKIIEKGIENTSDMAALLAEDPGALVQMIPPEARRFAFDGTQKLLGLSISGSVYLLTPEEVYKELVLFHESQQILPKGLGRSQPQPRIIATQLGHPLKFSFKLVVPGTMPRVVSQTWTFPGGAKSAAKEPAHTFKHAGQHDVHVTYIDKDNKTRTARIRHTIEGPKIDKTTVLNHNETLTVRKRIDPLDHFDVDDPGFGQFVSRTARSMTKMTQSRQKDITRFASKNEKQLKKWRGELEDKEINRLWTELVKLPIDRADARIDVWQKSGLAIAGYEFEAEVAKSLRSRGRAKTLGQLPSTVLRNLRDAHRHLIKDQTVGYSINQPVDRNMIADRIVAGVIVKSRVPAAPVVTRPITPRPGRGTRQPPSRITPIDARRVNRTKLALKSTNQRNQVLTSVLPKKTTLTQRRQIDALLRKAAAALPTDGQIDDVAAKVWETKLKADIINATKPQSGALVTDLSSLPVMKLNDPKQMHDLVYTEMANNGKFAKDRTKQSVFNGGQIVTWIDTIIGQTTNPTDTENTVHVPTGYGIFRRGTDELILTVATPTPRFDIKMYAGRYRIVLDDGSTHDLGNWTNAVAATPGKADILRASLEVRPTFHKRNRTAAEVDWVDSEERKPSSYQNAIFSREEYEILPTGGAHGPLSIGDLLRRSDGSYIVPDSPTLLAGLSVKIWGQDSAEVQLAGMMSAPNDVFLAGRANVNLSEFGYDLELDGEFRLITGDLWATALAGQTQLQANQLSFDGSIIIRKNGSAIVSGTAKGYISTDRPGDLELEIGTQISQAWTAEISDTSIFKIAASGALELKFYRASGSNGKFKLESDAKFDVTVQTAVPVMIDVEITPETTLCSWAPPTVSRPYWKKVCVTVPAVTMTVPDFSNTTWGTPTKVASPKLTITMGNTFSAKLKVDVAGLPGTGSTFDVDFPVP